jgi:hypothetical protein
LPAFLLQPFYSHKGHHSGEELLNKLKEQLIIECEQWCNNEYDLRCDYLSEEYPELFEIGELTDTDSTAERVVVASMVKVREKNRTINYKHQIRLHKGNVVKRGCARN